MAKPKLLLSVLVFLLIAAGAVSAQTVSIVSGQGQVTCAFVCPPSFEPLVVVVRDANGAPMPGQTVTWAVTSGSGTLENGEQVMLKATQSDGTSSIFFFQPTLPGTATTIQPVLQSAVTATVGTSSAVFYETSALTTGTGSILLQPSLVTPVVGSLLTGQAGQELANAVQVNIGVSNIAVRVEPFDLEAPGVTTIACVASPGQPAGVVLSDAAGIATCSLRFGGQTGTGLFRVVAGNTWSWGPINYEVLAGQPCAIRVLSGNNQSGNPGQTLPAPLLASVEDCGGNPLGSVPVVWSVTQGFGTLTGTRSSTDTTGRVSTNLTLGSTAGAVNVQVAVAPGTPTANNQPVSAIFTANVNVVISALQKLSGDNQDAALGAQFTSPLVVQVNNVQGQPVAGVPVAFAVATGSGAVATATATTDALGRASTTVTAGQTAGSLVVTASAGGFTQQFNLLVRHPGPSNVSFQNAAGFQANFIAPCGLATIRGTGLAPGIQGVIAPVFFGPLSYVVANSSVRFGNVFAPIHHVANMSGQESITVQVPCETVPGTVPVTIRVGGGEATFNAQVRAAAPGIFETVMEDNVRRAVIVKPDGTFASLANPVRRGEIARMYVTGLGQVTPAVGTNSPGIPDVESVVPNIGNIVAGVANAGVRVVSAKYAHGLIGVIEVAFEVPSDVPAGNLPLAVAVYEGTNLIFGNPSQIPVQ
jgi:uncharacterized protein (TIGR03437 family)